MNAQLHREAAEDTNFRKQIIFDDHARKVLFSLQIPKQKKGAILTKDTVKKEQPYNRNQKDQLFRLAFSEKKYQLDLYNAINGTNYTDPEDLEMTILEFISSIRELLNQGMSIQDASHAALKQGLEKGLLSDLLSRCETEVFAMLLEEYDAEEVLRYREQETAKETEQLTRAQDRKLFDLLLSQERYEDAKRAAKDPAYQLQLLSQYRI